MTDQEQTSSEGQKKPKITLSEDQERAVSQVLEWYKNARDGTADHTLTMGGYAGTGKTTVLSYIRKELGQDVRVGFVSFTGKAVSVMGRKLSDSRTFNWGLDTVSTIHSFMYKPILDEKGNIKDWEWKEMMREGESEGFFGKNTKAPLIDFFIMDEASMTPEDLYEDLLKYGKPILAVGDHGQLPPVKGNFNLVQDPTVRLEHIHRQAESSPILVVAHKARNGEPTLKYGEAMKSEESFVQRLNYGDLNGSPAEQEIMAQPGPDKMVIVGTNKERTGINQQILRYIRGDIPPDENKPRVGERVICLKNNHRLGIYNGMIGTVVNEKTCYEYPEHNWHFIIEADEGGTYPITATKYTFLNQYGKVPDDIPYFKLKERFDFAYAITCHKSQGSEADKVVVIGRGFGEPDIRRRWLYTAITRAKKELYLVG